MAILDTLLKITGLRSPAQAVESLSLLARSPEFRKSVTGGKLTPQEAEKLLQTKTLTINKNAPAKSASQLVGQSAADTLRMASFVVPFGKGASLATKTLLPGATVGGLGGVADVAETGKLDPLKLATDIIGGAAGAAAFKGLGKVGGAVSSKLKKEAAKGITRATPTAFDKAVKHGIDLNQLTQKYFKPGASLEDMVGAVNTKGKGGIIGQTIKQAEDQIQQTAKLAGGNIRIDGGDVINALKQEAKLIKRELGGEARGKAINNLIKQAESKYKNGVSVKRALETLRKANKRFGESVVETEGGAVVTAAQKLEANTLRNLLKSTFPDIAQALDTQAELLTLRPILNKSRATSETLGSEIRKGGLNLNPLQAFGIPQAAMTTPQIASQLFRGGVSLPQGIGEAAAARVPQLLGQTSEPVTPDITPSVTPEQNLQIPTMPITNQEQLSPGGQWKWDAQANDWVPNQNQTQQLDTQKLSQLLQQVAMKDLQTTGGQNLSTIQEALSTIKSVQELSGGVTGKGIPATQAQNLADFDASTQLVSQLDPVVDQFSSIMGPIQGRARVLNPYDTQSQAFNSQMAGVAQIVGRAMEGGVLRQEDVPKYRAILPQITDTPAVAKEKIKNVIQMLNTQKGARVSGFNQAGFDTSQITEDPTSLAMQLMGL